MTPKSLLRHPVAVSTLDDLAGSTFQTILDDPNGVIDPKKVLICSGKLYYELIHRRKNLEVATIAIVRLEQLYPFPEVHLQKVFKKYARAERWCWVQEEPENMGAWQFIKPRLERIGKKSFEYLAERRLPARQLAFRQNISRSKKELSKKQ